MLTEPTPAYEDGGEAYELALTGDGFYPDWLGPILRTNVVRRAEYAARRAQIERVRGAKRVESATARKHPRRRWAVTVYGQTVATTWTRRAAERRAAGYVPANVERS